MSVWESLQPVRPPEEQPEASSEASVYMRELVAVLDAHPSVFNERAALKIAQEPWNRLKAAPGEDQAAFVFEALAALPGAKTFALQLALKGITSSLLRGGIPLHCLDAVRLVEMSSKRRHSFPYKALLSALENVSMTPALRDALLHLRPLIDEWHGGREMQEIHERIDKLVHGAKEKPAEAVSGWTKHVFQEIDRSPKQITWRGLFLHARSLTQSSASRKWQMEAAAYADTIGRAEFLEAAHRWLALGPMPNMPPQAQVPEEEADYQKGFIWTLGALGDTSLAPDIADFAFACFRKIPQIGAVSHRVGNACVNALAAMPGLNAVTQISRLAMRVKYDVALRLIEKALVEAAQRNNVSRDDLEAMSVPSFGLNEEGAQREVAGNCEARLSVETGAALLSWFCDGKPVKSIPAEMKESHAAIATEMKKAAKELQAVLSTQRLRIERQLLSQTSCQFDRWKAWYLDHPVTSVFAKRLIWEIQCDGITQTAMWWHGSLADWTGNPVPVDPRSTVRLWHPIRAQVQEVLSWRCWLEDRGIRQPFKQAHREVYLLTDAERLTGTHSNRFAAHIVQQHQFAALCRERGWQFHLMGQWDSHNTPYLELPQHNLRVEFDVEALEDGEVSGHAIYRTISTDRIQFFAFEPKPRGFDITFRAPLRLADVPAVVFSEVMRDVDLLVGVTSIGADPTWGVEREDAHAAYWHRFADGGLSTVAENRKTILEALLPKLAIRDRCRLQGRYLVVRGESNEYCIHLGSGNILMEPGSRYLCIVRGPGDTASAVSLPFEGDSMLAIILSKAFLLSNDKAIKDETILRQIHQR